MEEAKKIKIEKTTERGYIIEELNIKDAINIINKEIEANRTIFIDGKPWFGDFITEEALTKCRKEVSITNQLIGG